MAETLGTLLAEIRSCRICAPVLPLGPRPVLRAAASARLLLVGQAPGTRVHASGVPWDDPSGDRLRAWLGLDREAFYDERRIAIVPMGFCYPGRSGGGDAPPRPECAPAWRQRVLDLLPDIRLTIVIGRYAQAWHLGDRQKDTLTATVKAWVEYEPAVIPAPHPSPRNAGWLRANPWFEEGLVPVLRSRVSAALMPE